MTGEKARANRTLTKKKTKCDLPKKEPYRAWSVDRAGGGSRAAELTDGGPRRGRRPRALGSPPPRSSTAVARPGCLNGGAAATFRLPPLYQ